MVNETERSDKIHWVPFDEMEAFMRD